MVPSINSSLVAAFLLPFGSGSAPAAKGVITDMCSESQRADALNAVTLVENIARLSTQGLFGFVFSSLSGVGKAYITFFCNAVSFVMCQPNWTMLMRLMWMGIVGNCSNWNGSLAVFPLPTCGQYTG